MPGRNSENLVILVGFVVSPEFIMEALWSLLSTPELAVSQEYGQFQLVSEDTNAR